MTQEERNRFILDSYRQAEEALALAMEARAEAQTRVEKAHSAVQAWRTIMEQSGLNKTKAVNGNGSMPPEVSPPVPPRRAWQSSRERLTASASTSSAPVKDEPASKADFVFMAIDNSGQRGITAAEIKSAAAKAGIEAYKGYPYTVVYKLRERGKVILNDQGKYVTKR